MPLPDFKLERYFAQWEFKAPHLLCASDVEGYPMCELLALADAECTALWDSLTLGYTESAGHPLLREAIASQYANLSPEHILTFAGAEEAIFTLMHVVLETGSHALVTWPGYQSLYEVARAVGAEATLLELDTARGWQLDLDALQQAIRPETRLLVTNFPHNPTGALPDQQTYTALTELVEQHGLCWLSDEVYRLLEYAPEHRLPHACDTTPRAVSLGVMSKAYGLAGLRVGWIATQDTALLQRAAAFKDYLTICNSAPAEILALIALRNQETLLARSHKIIRSNLALLDAFFARWQEVLAWVRPLAGSVAFPRLRNDTQPIDAFVHEVREQQGVLLLPGSVYDYPGNHFRIGFGRTTMPAALARLEVFLAGWKKH